jgi:hypothetical protein
MESTFTVHTRIKYRITCYVSCCKSTWLNKRKKLFQSFEEFLFRIFALNDNLFSFFILMHAWIITNKYLSQGAGIVTQFAEGLRYGPNDRGIELRFLAGVSSFFSSSQLPDRLWGLSSTI